ncbi:MAG: AAA family ATPase [Desulfopila sp.]|jgi:general secretion pathway protein A|nr:AAA family ATPase [Desulfopila sp.]
MPPSNNESLYLNCYGLTSAPFRLSPDPEFFFPSKPHIAARKVLKYAIQNDEGFMILSGPAGTGKTLLLRVLLQETGKGKITTVLTNPVLSPSGLLHQILLELGLKVDASIGEENLLATFQKVLLKIASLNKDILVIVDEAQNIPLKTLEYLRMLSNIETNQRKLLQILLTGQPELEDLLKDPRLAQLSQRIAVHETLRPFSATETLEYVNYRLAKAGRGDLGLSFFAKKALFRLTGGIPRLVNRLMDRTLLIACTDYKGKLTRRHIYAAAKTLPGDTNLKLFGLLPSLGYVFVAILVFALVLSAFILRVDHG